MTDILMQAFFQDFQLQERNRMTGGAGQTGTHWGSVVWGVLQVCWGLTRVFLVSPRSSRVNHKCRSDRTAE
jgi:hypothetical protein